MQFKSNIYLLLDIAPTATLAEIKKAYWQKSKLMHPDTGGSVEEQIELNQAYEILADPRLRKAHDRFWKLKTPKKRQADQGIARRAPAQTRDGKQTRARQRARSSQPDYQPDNFHAATSLWDEFTSRIKEALKRETEKARQASDASLQAAKVEFLLNFKAARLKWGLIAGCMLLCAGLGFLFNLLWSGILVCLYILYRYREIKFGDTELTVFDADWNRKLEVAARRRAQAGYEQDLARVTAKYEQLLHGVVLLRKPVRYTDTEHELAQRIILAFFLSGYRPVEFIPDKRLIIAARGAEQVVIRYRQRKGAPANVAYVKELYQRMRHCKAEFGYLFAIPGLSAQAAAYAKSHQLTAYALEAMNDWLAELGCQKITEQAANEGISIEALASFIQSNLPQPVAGDFN